MKVYLSSTYRDLAQYRERAYRTMRRARLDVIAMEDYVAQDERPVDKCLADVAASDLYVGLFGFRYGHISRHDNPDGCSVTELEYRQAVARNIPRLIFLAEQKGWSLDETDFFTGEGDQGVRITKLREDLREEAMVGSFSSPEELARKLAESLLTWLPEHGALGAAPDESLAVAPSQRQVRNALLLLHAPIDTERATALARAVSGVWPVETSGTGLTAAEPEDLKALDRAACAARSAGVLLSTAALTMLTEDQERSARVLGLARERTGVLLGVPAEEMPAEAAAAWGFTEVLPLAAGPGGPGRELHSALLRRAPRPQDPELGLPVVVVAMTGAEAAELVAAPPAPLAGLIGQRPQDWWLGRYGPSAASGGPSTAQTAPKRSWPIRWPG